MNALGVGLTRWQCVPAINKVIQNNRNHRRGDEGEVQGRYGKLLLSGRSEEMYPVFLRHRQRKDFLLLALEM
jgi:hypothetical protein